MLVQRAEVRRARHEIDLVRRPRERAHDEVLVRVRLHHHRLEKRMLRAAIEECVADENNVIALLQLERQLRLTCRDDGRFRPGLLVDEILLVDGVFGWRRLAAGQVLRVLRIGRGLIDRLLLGLLRLVLSDQRQGGEYDGQKRVEGADHKWHRVEKGRARNR